MKKVELYTDGACKGNPGPGGYGAILVYGGVEKAFSGGEALTTNNRMELLGAITGLAALKEPCEVVLTSDSKYLVDAVNKKWAVGWRKKGWKKGDGKPAQHRPVGAAARPFGHTPRHPRLGQGPRRASLQ